MRVLVIGALPRLGSPNRLPWIRYTTAALRRLGHTVATATLRESWGASPALALARAVSGRRATSGALTRYVAAMAARRDRQTIAAARRFRPQLTIVLKGEVCGSEVWAGVKRHTDGPLVSWWVDDPFAYPQSVRDFALFDRVFLFDRSYLPPLASAGIGHAAFLPCAGDEQVYRPQALSASDRRRWATDVAFVGSYYPNRAALVRALAGSVDVGVWGQHWNLPAAGRELDSKVCVVRGCGVGDKAAARIYAATAVGLNVHHPQSRLGGLNMRTFELLAAGVAQLVDWIPGTDELLEPGREIVCYRSVDEAREMAIALLNDPRRRADVAQRGRERVLRDHTYVARMRTLCEMAFQ